MERTEGVEPSPPTLEGGALPMSYIRANVLARGRVYGNQKLLLGLIARRARASGAPLVKGLRMSESGPERTFAEPLPQFSF